MSPKKRAMRPKMKKAAPKAQPKNNMLILAEKVEKEFHQIPNKLAKLYRQELMSRKQQEIKLQNELKKAEMLQSAAQKKQAALATAGNKKHLATAKKSYEQATKTIKTIQAKLTQWAKDNNALLAKQTKYSALDKELIKLGKQLTLKANTLIAKTKSKKKPVKKVKMTQTPVEKTERLMTEQTPFDTFSETEMD